MKVSHRVHIHCPLWFFFLIIQVIDLRFFYVHWEKTKKALRLGNQLWNTFKVFQNHNLEEDLLLCIDKKQWVIWRLNQKLKVFLTLLDFPTPMHSSGKWWASSWEVFPFCPASYPLVQFIIDAYWPFAGHAWEETVYLFSQSLSRLWKSEVSFSLPFECYLLQLLITSVALPLLDSFHFALIPLALGRLKAGSSIFHIQIHGYQEEKERREK